MCLLAPQPLQMMSPSLLLRPIATPHAGGGIMGGAREPVATCRRTRPAGQHPDTDSLALVANRVAGHRVRQLALAEALPAPAASWAGLRKWGRSRSWGRVGWRWD